MSGQRPATPKQSKGQVEAKAREARERREAVAAVVEAADLARTFELPDDRVLVEALASDVLWPHDEPTARALFMRAWATASEIDDYYRTEADASSDPDDAYLPHEPTVGERLHLLSTLAKHDPALAEKFFKELLKEDEQAKRADRQAQAEMGAADDDADDAPSKPERSPWGEPSRAGAWRLGLAGSLAGEGKFEQAAAVAAPLASERVSSRLMVLLFDLRAKLPAAADAIYAGLLERTLADSDADANDVLLLSAYVVSPQTFVVVDARGSLQYSTTAFRSFTGREETTDHAPPPRVRAAFFRTAAAVLSRAASPGASPADSAARFYAVTRLLPFFEREAPQFVAQLQARRAAISSEIEEARREQFAAQAEVRAASPRANPSDPLRWQIDNAALGKTDGERDHTRLNIVGMAADLKMWDRARKFAADITDPTLRGEAASYILRQQVLSVGEGFRDEKSADDFERAAAFVRNADVEPFARSLGLAQAAQLAASHGRKERAEELLREAAVNADAVAPKSGNRITAYAVLTVAAADAASQLAWEFFDEAVRPGDWPAEHPPNAEETDAAAPRTFALVPSPPRNLPSTDDLFAAVSRLDSARALAVARTLKDPVRRAYALIAVARERLERGGRVRKPGEKQ